MCAALCVALSPHLHRRLTWHSPTEQKNLLEDLQMRLSENIDRAPPMTAKQHRETARRGALYGHNPIALFKKPKYKRPKSAPFG